jgi:hypothetical protein
MQVDGPRNSSESYRKPRSCLAWNRNVVNSAEIRSYGICGLRFDATYPKRPCIESQDLGSCWWSPDLQESGGHVTDLDGKELDFTAGRRLKANRGMIVARPGMQLLFLMS